MSVHANVRVALKTRLATVPTLPALAQENRPFEAQVGTPWLRERFMAQESALKSLGPRGLIRHSGVWFLDLFVAPKQGISEADTLADQVLALFPPGTVLSYGGQSVTIQSSSRSGGRPETEWFMTPLVISWYADTVNTI